MEPTLKPCPFCGEAAKCEEKQDAYVSYIVRCIGCLAQTSEDIVDKGLAVTEWNSRHTPELDILLEAIREEIKKSGGNVRLEEALEKVGLGLSD